MTYKEKALAATRGSQLGAVLAAAFGEEIDAPRFDGKATVTSDGFVMCNFIDKNENYYMGAFVGSVHDLYANIQGLSDHLSLNKGDRDQLKEKINQWIEKDWRS